MKKYLILFSFLLINVSLVNGQDCYKPCLYRASIDSTKINIYTHLLEAKELKTEDTLVLVDVQSNDLDIDFFSGIYFFINNITEKLDTVSVKKLSKSFLLMFTTFMMSLVWISIMNKDDKRNQHTIDLKRLL